MLAFMGPHRARCSLGLSCQSSRSLSFFSNEPSGPKPSSACASEQQPRAVLTGPDGTGRSG